MQSLRLANGLAEKGYRVTVGCLRRGGEYEGRLDPRVRLVHLTSGVRSSTFAGVLAKRPLRRLLSDIRPDVGVALLGQTCRLLADVAARLPSRPALLLGVQNNLDAELMHYPWWQRGWLRQRLGHAFGVADEVIALSKGAADALVRLYPAVKHKTRVIYNAGFEPAVMVNARSASPHVDPRRPVLVACGRLHVQKDYPTLLRALVRVRAKIPHARLWILGEGPERRALEREVHQLGLVEAVDFLGFQSNPHAYIAQADVFVLSSCWEGFGNVLVEAMVCDVPVVSTDRLYGPREIIEPEQSGLLAPVRDATALADAVLRILVEPGLADRLRQGAKLRAQVFSADASVAAYEAVARALIAARSGAPRKTTEG